MGNFGDYTREAKAKANTAKLDREGLEHIVATVTRWMDTEGTEDESINGGDLVDAMTELLDSFELFDPKGSNDLTPVEQPESVLRCTSCNQTPDDSEAKPGDRCPSCQNPPVSGRYYRATI